MSKGYSGLFSNTTGIPASSKVKSQSSTMYHATQSLVNHINFVESSSSGKNDIKGGHNETNFLKEINRIGAKIIDCTKISQIDGVSNYFYKMPKKIFKEIQPVNIVRKHFKKQYFIHLKSVLKLIYNED